jgi:hypothetical protein
MTEQDSNNGEVPPRVNRKGQMTSTACLRCRKQKVKVPSPLPHNQSDLDRS